MSRDCVEWKGDKARECHKSINMTWINEYMRWGIEVLK